MPSLLLFTQPVYPPPFAGDKFAQGTPENIQSNRSIQLFQNPTTESGSSPYPQDIQKALYHGRVGLQPQGEYAYGSQPIPEGPSAPPLDPNSELEFPLLNPYTSPSWF